MSTPTPNTLGHRLGGLARAAQRLNLLVGLRSVGVKVHEPEVKRLSGVLAANTAEDRAALAGGPRFRGVAASGMPRTVKPAAASSPKSLQAVSSVTPAKAARTAARQRTATVFGSEHSQGRERQAADMLATSMSADEITGLLAKSPKPAAANTMLAAIRAQANPKLGPGGASKQTDQQRIDAMWARAHAANARP